MDNQTKFSHQDGASEPDSQNHKPLLSDSDETPTQGYVLRLFVSGDSLATENTLETLHQLLERSLNRPYTLRVIDVIKHPEQAEASHISATPTLMKVWPKPKRRIVGELSDVDTILRLLGLLED